MMALPSFSSYLLQQKLSKKTIVDKLRCVTSIVEGEEEKPCEKNLPTSIYPFINAEYHIFLYFDDSLQQLTSLAIRLHGCQIVRPSGTFLHCTKHKSKYVVQTKA